MYFSGHLLDNYSNHISSIKTDKLSEIIYSAQGAPDSKYKDKDTVKIVGIIAAKRTKTVKNGEIMAFVKLEGRTSEIETIVFSRQYSKFSQILCEDNAVMIEGTLSFEDGEGVRVILSDAVPLISNDEFSSVLGETAKVERIYIKMASITDYAVNKITRLAMLNPGSTEIVIYDASEKKYRALKDAAISVENKRVLEKLYDGFGKENIVLK